jgi:methylated-DNA-[protein]-cysteine S-methyltransferase
MTVPRQLPLASLVGTAQSMHSLMFSRHSCSSASTLPGSAPCSRCLLMLEEQNFKRLRGRLSATFPLDPPLRTHRYRGRAVMFVACALSDTSAQQAASMGKPSAVRAVGGANSRNPIFLARPRRPPPPRILRSFCPLAQVVPCHRVIGADGSLTGAQSAARAAAPA